MIIRTLVARFLRSVGYSEPDCIDISRQIAAKIKIPEKTIDNFVGLEMDDKREGPRIVSSIIPMMRRLKRLLPKTVPTARSGESVNVTALTPVKISGKDVAVASITAPRNPRLSPV